MLLTLIGKNPFVKTLLPKCRDEKDVYYLGKQGNLIKSKSDSNRWYRYLGHTARPWYGDLVEWTSSSLSYLCSPKVGGIGDLFYKWG